MTWLRSAQHVCDKWQHRNRTERFLLLEAFLFLGIARLGLMILPFRWLSKTLGEPMKETDPRIQDVDLQFARMIGSAVCSASSYSPWKSVCLTQGVAAQWMLKRRRIPGTIYLGVKKDEMKQKKIAAHAWLRCGPNIITGETGRQQFTVISIFS